MRSKYGADVSTRLLTTVFACVLASACAQQQPIGSVPGVVELALDELPVPVAYGENGRGLHYVIGPYDKLLIDVYGIEDFSREVVVDGGGSVSFPIAGTMPAAGMTTAELASLITTRIDRYVREPIVTVNTLEITSQRITVDGAVERPDRYVASGNLTLMDAVAMAGGLKEDAGLEEVVIFRQVADQRFAGVYSLEAIRRGNYPDPRVFPEDIVVVGSSPRRAFIDRLIELAPLITTPIILLTRR